MDDGYNCQELWERGPHAGKHRDFSKHRFLPEFTTMLLRSPLWPCFSLGFRFFEKGVVREISPPFFFVKIWKFFWRVDFYRMAYSIFPLYYNNLWCLGGLWNQFKFKLIKVLKCTSNYRIKYLSQACLLVTNSFSKRAISCWYHPPYRTIYCISICISYATFFQFLTAISLIWKSSSMEFQNQLFQLVN